MYYFCHGGCVIALDFLLVCLLVGLITRESCGGIVIKCFGSSKQPDKNQMFMILRSGMFLDQFLQCKVGIAGRKVFWICIAITTVQAGR